MTEAPMTETKTTCINDVPFDVLTHIFQSVPYVDQLAVACVNSLCRAAVSSLKYDARIRAAILADYLNPIDSIGNVHPTLFEKYDVAVFYFSITRMPTRTPPFCIRETIAHAIRSRDARLLRLALRHDVEHTYEARRIVASLAAPYASCATLATAICHKITEMCRIDLMPNADAYFSLLHDCGCTATDALEHASRAIHNRNGTMYNLFSDDVILSAMQCCVAKASESSSDMMWSNLIELWLDRQASNHTTAIDRFMFDNLPRIRHLLIARPLGDIIRYKSMIPDVVIESAMSHIARDDMCNMHLFHVEYVLKLLTPDFEHCRKALLLHWLALASHVTYIHKFMQKHNVVKLCTRDECARALLRNRFIAPWMCDLIVQTMYDDAAAADDGMQE
jgi:hypothetical protein